MRPDPRSCLSSGSLTVAACVLLALWLLGPTAVLRGQSPKYAGDIREDDLRVKDLRASLLSGGQNLPAALRLRYSGPRGDYLAFYDLAGIDVYFRYREDRFDRRAEKKLRDLIAGQAYSVQGRFRGVIHDGVFYEQGAAEFPENLASPGSILAFEFVAATPLRLDQILY